MREGPQILLDRLSNIVFELLPWSLSGAIGLYLLWGAVIPGGNASHANSGLHDVSSSAVAFGRLAAAAVPEAR